MRASKVGWVLVGFFFLAGIGFWITMPEVWIGQIWVGVALFLAIYYFGMGHKADQAESLMKTGVRGQAQILEMTQTGTYINNQPRVKLRLQVQAPGVAMFEDTRTITVPLIALGQLSTGVPLTVFMTPDKPRDYVIDWSGGGGAPAAQSAFAGGVPITVEDQSGGSHNLMSNTEAGMAVMRVLKEHGIDPSSGEVDLRNVASARAAVLQALKDHGIDVAHQVAAASPATSVQASGEPLAAMTKLKQLHDAGLITDKDFAENKDRILKGL
jgi:hypothetical protein